VGETLGVATVLEGSVRRAGTRLRITAQLADAAQGQQLWSERYDREVADVFAVQDEIAGAIAGRLRITFHPGAERDGGVRRGTKSLEAYELVLKGRALQVKRGRFVKSAIACFERAIELDPGYADALALLADGWRLLGTFGVARPDEVMPRAKELASRALAIDPQSAEAWATLADVEVQYDRDWRRARDSFGRALASDPRHVRSLCEWASWGWGFDAHPLEEALGLMRRAIEVDPLNAWVAGMHSLILGLAQRNEESLAEAERSVAIDTDSFFGQWSLVRAHAWAGDHERAIALSAEPLAASGRHPWVLATVGWSYGALGDAARSRAVHDEMEARSRHETIGPFWLAATAAAAGLPDAAIAFAERAVAERDALVVHARRIPAWDGVRALPRFEDVVRGVWDGKPGDEPA
jgi:serine/threonine-protein kinase